MASSIRGFHRRLDKIKPPDLNRLKGDRWYEKFKPLPYEVLLELRDILEIEDNEMRTAHFRRILQKHGVTLDDENSDAMKRAE